MTEKRTDILLASNFDPMPIQLKTDAYPNKIASCPIRNGSCAKTSITPSYHSVYAMRFNDTGGESNKRLFSPPVDIM